MRGRKQVRCSCMVVAFAAACFMAFTAFPAQVFLEGESLWSPPAQGAARSGPMRLKSAADPSWRTWAVQAAEALKDRLGVEVAPDDLSVKSVSPDEAGNVHVRLAQQYKGVPVRGNQLIVHFRASGAAYVVNGDFLPGISLDIVPTVPCPAGGVLMVWSPPGASDASSARLAWRVPQGAKWVYQDAHSGATLAVERRSRRADADEEDYDDESWLYDYFLTYGPKARTQPLPAGSPCVIRGQLPRPLWTNDAPCVVEVPGIKGYDGYYYLCGTNSNGREFAIWNAEGVADAYRSAPDRVTPLPSSADANALVRYSSADWGDYHPEAIAAASHLIMVMDYYQGEFGRATYLGANNVRTCAFVCLPAKDSKGRVVGGYDNAFFFSDIDGSTASHEAKNSGAMYFGYPSSGAATFQVLDVTAHEFSHGIANSTADFLYEGEPGALDESFADIFGVGCENLYQSSGPAYPSFTPQTTDWFLGEDVGYEKPLRDLVNPSSSFSDSPQPSVYRDSHWADTTPYSEDQGGVHSNSGVQNRFFYLLQKEIGLRPALQIAYHVVTKYCSSQTGYVKVASLWAIAAADLAGSSVNGVDIPADSRSIVASCWTKVMAKPAYKADKKRTFVGYILEAGLFAEVDVGKAENGRVAITVKVMDFEGWEYGVSQYSKLSGGKAKIQTQLGNMSFDFAADNIYCEWKVARAFLADPTTPLTFSFMVVNRAPLFLSSLDEKLPRRAFAGVKMNVSIYDHISAWWGDYLVFTAKGLPKGVSLNRSTGKLSGTPSKAQNGTAKLTAKSMLTGRSRTYSWKYSFTALPSWARRNYGAYVMSGDGTVGDVKVKVTSAGVVSGKLKIKNAVWNLSAKGYSSVVGTGEVFKVTATAKKGKKSMRVPMEITPAGISGKVTINGVVYTFSGGPEIAMVLDAEPLPETDVYLVPAGVATSIVLVVTSDSPYTISAKNLPAGLKLVKSGGLYVVSGKATKPGELPKKAQFSVKNHAVPGGKTFTFRILVDNYHSISIPLDDHYDDMIAGVPARFSIVGATNCVATGLPPGLSFSKTTGEVAGVPKAPGKHLVTFTRTIGTGKKAKKSVATSLFVVYQGNGCDASCPGVIADGLALHAATAGVNGPDACQDELVGGQVLRIYAGVSQNIPIEVSGGLDGVANTMSCSKLPSGLTFTKGRIKGVAKNPGEKKTVKLTATNKWKWTGCLKFTLEVVSLPGWAKGTYNGGATAIALNGGGASALVGRRAGLEGTASLSVSSTGKISGKYAWPDGVSHVFPITSFHGVDDDGFFSTGGISSEGKVKWSSGVRIESEEFPASDGSAVLRGVAVFSTMLKSSPYDADAQLVGSNGFFVAELRQNIWSSKKAKLPAFAFTKKIRSFSKKVTGVGGYNLTFKFGEKGAVTVSAAKSGKSSAVATVSSHLTLLDYAPDMGWSGEVAVVIPKINFCEVFKVAIADVDKVSAADIVLSRAD